MTTLNEYHAPRRNLFDIPEDSGDAYPFACPPHSGGATSIAAAEEIKPSASTLREMVFEFIRKRPDGATREEIQEGLGLSGDTVRPRVWELQKAKRVQATTETRKTASGRMAEVLRVTRDESKRTNSSSQEAHEGGTWRSRSSG